MALAKKAGVSQSTIGNLEAGLRESPRQLLEIAAALGVSPLWLKTGEGTEDKNIALRHMLTKGWCGDDPAFDASEVSHVQPHTVEAKQAQSSGGVGSVSSPAWPFDGLSHERWAALTERQKGRVEAAALAELRLIEAEQATAATANRNAA